MYEEYDSLDFFFFFEASFLGACGAVRPSTTAARRRGGLCSLSRVRGGSAGVGAGQRGSGARPRRLATRVVERATDWHGVFSNGMECGRGSGSPWRISCWESWPCCRVCVFGCDETS